MVAYHSKEVSQWCANSQVSAGVWLGAAVANDPGSHRHPWFAQVLYLGFCLCFIKSIMQMHDNKGETWLCTLEMAERLSLSFVRTKVYFLLLSQQFSKCLSHVKKITVLID